MLGVQSTPSFLAIAFPLCAIVIVENGGPAFGTSFRDDHHESHHLTGRAGLAGSARGGRGPARDRRGAEAC